MLVFHLMPEDRLNTRFAYSPLIETTISFIALRHQEKMLVSQPRWAEQARQALQDVELTYLTDLAASGRYIPDFLTPTPEGVRHTFEDELQKLVQTPEAVIRRTIQQLIELDGDSAIRQQFLMYPREMVWCLTEDLRLYWQRTLVSHWAQLTSILEGDILYRARQLAVDGVGTVFEDLSSKIRFTPSTVYLNLAKQNVQQEYHLDGRGIQLVPSVFGLAHISWQVSPDYLPMFIYKGRGRGQWQQEKPRLNQALETLIGGGRASVLLQLVTPSTTTELAHKLYMTAGAVSQHLDKLHQAGLVEAHRSGRRVYYHLTQRGSKLLAVFEG
jgi:DNA-binding HxlR family transcriptional regulator